MATNFFHQCVAQKLKCAFTHRPVVVLARCSAVIHGWLRKIHGSWIPVAARSCALQMHVACKRALLPFWFQGVWS